MEILLFMLQLLIYVIHEIHEVLYEVVHGLGRVMELMVERLQPVVQVHCL